MARRLFQRRGGYLKTQLGGASAGEFDMKSEEYVGLNASARRVIVLLALALAISGGAAQAQSGRRLPNRSDPPPSQPSTAPTPPVDQPSSNKPDKPKQQLVVSRSMNDGFSNYHADIVLRACLDRLKEGAYASISLGREMNRKQASDLAKNATDTHVLWIDWDFGRMDSSQSDPSQTNSAIDYVLYIPGTGKIKISGRVYPGDYRKRMGVGGVGIPLPIPNSAAALEYICKESGREIAQRVIDSLNLGRPNH